MTEGKKPTGRPSLYSQEMADRICSEIIQGYSLRTICKPDDMPSVVTILTWLREKPSFLTQYEKAKEEQADALAEEMLDIADDGTNDWMVKTGKGGESVGWQLNGEHVQRSRLRLDARKWIASKLKPKKYGDRILTDVQNLGRDGLPVDPNEHKIDITTRVLRTLPEQELKAILDENTGDRKPD